VCSIRIPSSETHKHCGSEAAQNGLEIIQSRTSSLRSLLRMLVLYEGGNHLLRLACVASVSVGFGSKELQREKWSE